MFVNTHLPPQDVSLIDEFESLDSTSRESNNATTTYQFICRYVSLIHTNMRSLTCSRSRSRNIDDYKSYVRNYIPCNSNDEDSFFKRGNSTDLHSTPYIVMQDLAGGNHSFTNSHTYSLTHSLTHSLTKASRHLVLLI